MRLFLLPITRRTLPQRLSKTLPKVTSITSSPNASPKPSSETLPPSHILLYAQRLNLALSPKTSIVERVTARASKTWSSWESKESGWQKKVTSWGNSALARIPYQEWGLKSVPPLSARRKTEELKGVVVEKKGDGKDDKVQDRIGGEVEVLYPAGLLRQEEVAGVLERLATEREDFHRRWMWASIIGAPFTAPVALIPVIPNLPFFYLAFRGWSHWRALTGSKHVQFLINNNLTRVIASEALQRIYDTKAIPREDLSVIKERVKDVDIGIAREKLFGGALRNVSSSPSPEGTPTTKDSRILVSKTTGRLISLCFGVPQVDVEMERAMAQVERLLKKEDEEGKEKTSQDEKEEEKSTKKG